MNRDSSADPDRDPSAIPPAYGIDRVVAMPRSPQYLFVYWELSGPKSEQWRAKDPDCQWYLRVTETVSGWRSDVRVDPEAANFYLKVKAGGRYVVELGVMAGSTFHPVCRSRDRELPTGEPSEAEPVVWAGLHARPAPDGEEPPHTEPARAEDAEGEPGLEYDPSLLTSSSWPSDAEAEE